MDDYPDPEDLLPFYERELSRLRRSLREFSEQFPRAGAKLGISGEHSDDPHVERLIQSAALLNARAAARIDDDYPEMPTAMLERLHPEVLRPFPASSIAQIRAVPDPSRGPLTITRGTQFISHYGKYRFRSAYDVTLVPLSIAEARYASVAVAPRGVTLPRNTSGVLSVTFDVPAEHAGLATIPDCVRIYLDGAPETIAALTDTFLLRAIAAFADLDDRGQWKALETLPVAAAGFDDVDSMFGFGVKKAFPLRLLLEYFAFPERFHFIDVNFAMLRQAVKDSTQGSTRVTLHLAVAGVHRDSQIARRLSALTAANLKLFCTPVINLFQRDAEPAEPAKIPGYAAPRYPVVPRGVTVAETEVWAIDAVCLHDGAGTKVIEPLHAFGHRKYYGAPVWELLRNGRTVRENLGYESAIVLRKLDGEPVRVDPKQLSIKITCTNRNLPAGMPVGASDGDLEALDTDIKCPIVLLRQPTQSQQPKPASGYWWQLLSQLSPHTGSVDQTGLAAVKALFLQFAAHSGRNAWHIDGMTSLSWRSVMLWTTAAGAGSFEHGIEITMTLNEQRFASDSMSVLIGVMERFFAAYVHINSAVQLVVVSAHTGTVIRQCPPREGCLPMI